VGKDPGIRVAVTLGDPCGIGPEVLARAIALRPGMAGRLVIVGDRALLMRAFRSLGLRCPGGSRFLDIPVPRGAALSPGRSGRLAGMLSARWLEAGTRLVLSGGAGALVTGPVAKSSVALAVPGFRGQTEFVARLARAPWPVMMMAGPRLKAVVGTRHIPLKDVPRRLNGPMLDRTIAVTALGLRRWFGIRRPRLAVCGLNPHAGEGGLLGLEDRRVIRPAIARAVRRGIRASGPHPADAVFTAALKGGYDAVIGMYHDQASIAAKTVDGPLSVNVTLGLPFLRTSPAHGTAFDIAGRRRADPSSMLAALRLGLGAAGSKAAGPPAKLAAAGRGARRG